AILPRQQDAGVIASRYLPEMRISCLVLLSILGPASLTAQDTSSLETQLKARIAQDTATVGLVFRDPYHHEQLAIDGCRRFRAASTMKVPVLIELVRRIDAGELRWSDRLTVRNSFASIVDGSAYQLDPADDSDSTLYAAQGQSLTLAELSRR